MTHRKQTPAERFWAKVDRRGDDECWPWTASLQNGYGQIYWRGRPVKAQRASWEVNRGPIPHGQHVLHECDNPICVNPKHLFLGTHLDNLADMRAKGRANPWPQPRLRGVAHPHAKLTPASVREIRRRSSRSESTTSLADRFGVDRMTVKSALIGKTWGHVI